MKAATTDLRERLDAVEVPFVDLWNNMVHKSYQSSSDIWELFTLLAQEG